MEHTQSMLFKYSPYECIQHDFGATFFHILKQLSADINTANACMMILGAKEFMDLFE